MQQTRAIWAPQPGPQVRATSCPVKTIFFGGSRGGGKMLSNSSKILTPKGWITHGSVKVGDRITNPVTGGAQKVIGVFPQGKLDIYRVQFDDGSVTHAGLEHLWAFKCANRPRPGTKKAKQREWVKQKFGFEYLSGGINHFKVGSTATLINDLAAGRHNPRIPLTAPVLFDVNGRTGKNNIDPYLIGLMLGDGTFSNGGRGNLICTGDFEVAEYLQRLGFCRSGKNELSWYLSRGSSVGKILSRWAANHKLLSKTGNEKFLPPYVLTASIDYRVSVLQGLLDSDGYVDDRGHVEFTNISESLVYAVRDIVWSLGGKATVSKPIVGKYRAKSGEIVECQEYRRVYIWTPFSSKLFRLKRKSERCTDSWNGGHENMRKVVSIDYSHREEATCITVSSPHGLYVTDDFIVTHNSDAAIGRHILGANRYGSAWNGLIVRRKYKEFAEMRRRWDELKAAGLPVERIGGDQQQNILKFSNGAHIIMTAIERLATARDWVGNQFTEISIEEATTFPFFGEMIDFFKGSLRSPHGVPTHIFCTGNPGGPGHNNVKEFFKLGSEWESQGFKANSFWFDDAGESRVFIKSFLQDNKILMEKDPAYVKVLLSISDSALRKAWIDGDWDVFIGQAFTFIPQFHVIDPIPIPEWAPLYMTYDWGYGAPFSIGWWFVDNDGRVIRFAEWYGWDGTPNKGLRLEDSEVARGIIRREYEMGIHKRKIDRLSGPDCFSKKPNYLGGGQGPSTAEVFKISGIELRPGDPDRNLKIRQFRERLKIPEDRKSRPMMQVFSTCRHFIRTIPSLAIDEDDVEYIDTDQECHVFDEACHIAMARPLVIGEEDVKQQFEQRKREAERAALPQHQQAVWSELDRIREGIERMEQQDDDWDGRVGGRVV